jgi:arginase
MTGRSAVLRHLREARQAIEKHRPARVLTSGGDCLVDLPPIAYLSTHYGETPGVLWVDAHPDLTTPKDYPNAHAHVLGALRGRGIKTSFARLKRRWLRRASCTLDWTLGRRSKTR